MNKALEGLEGTASPAPGTGCVACRSR